MLITIVSFVTYAFNQTGINTTWFSSWSNQTGFIIGVLILLDL